MNKQCSCDKLDECNGENCTYKELQINPETELTEDIIHSIREIIGYMWPDEEKSYQENPSKDHIFRDVRKVGTWLDNLIM